jgi:hypothetical protein
VDIISFLLEFSFEFIKIRYQQKCQNYFFINVWRKSTFDIYFTEFGATKLPNSEQSYKGKVKTHMYITGKISRQPENCENRNDPDVVQAFLKKWWVDVFFFFYILFTVISWNWIAFCYLYIWGNSIYKPLEDRFLLLSVTPRSPNKKTSTHHFFRNACTKSGSLRFSQFSGCWLILSVYIIMSFDFPFVRLFGVR